MLLHFIVLLLSSLHPGVFVEYQVQSLFPDTSQMELGLLIESVVALNDNGTFTYNITYISLNSSEVLPSSLVLDDLNDPTTFYYVPDPGSRILARAIPFQLLNYSGGEWVYSGFQEVEYVSVYELFWVNGSGVPSKVVFVQVGQQGQVVGKTVYTLLRTNLISPGESPYIPSGVHSNSKYISVQLGEGRDFLSQGVVVFNLVAIPLLLFLTRRRVK
jgi:hypothetical protein